MQIQFVSADISEFRAARRQERIRSPEVRQLIQIMSELGHGKAKAVIAERGESIKTLRGRVSYAARNLSVKIRIVQDGDRLLFSLQSPRQTSASTVREGAIQRKQAVQAKAIAVGSRLMEISADDVVTALDPATLEGMKRPGTMVGAVLRSMNEFERVGHNRFRYRS